MNDQRLVSKGGGKGFSNLFKIRFSPVVTPNIETTSKLTVSE